MLKCWDCQELSMVQTVYSDTFTRKDGSQFTVDGLLCYVCQNCGADPVSQAQITYNEELIRHARLNSGYTQFKRSAE